MSDTVIKVENLGKRYRLGKFEKEDTFAGQLKNTLLYPIKNFRRIASMSKFKDDENDPSIFWALQDVNFEVKRGEVLGIIGHNGAGKSTLLKLLSKITEPTTGRIEMKGRVSALLEVGTGFHPELTGRDNVYMNGTILGMTKKEIDARFEEIVDFAGVAKHIDTPVKFYSSGMKVRLGFSVAAHLEPEILIIDEVLAVGDFNFQQKCIGKMNDVANSGRTVIFVSHQLNSVSQLCSKCILLDKGQLRHNGNVDATISIYKDASRIKAHNLENEIIYENQDYKILRVWINGENNKSLKTGNNLIFNVEIINKMQIDFPLRLSIMIKDIFDQTITTLNPELASKDFKLKAGKSIISCQVKHLNLYWGEYLVDLICKFGFSEKIKLEKITRFSIDQSSIYSNGKLPRPKCILLAEQNWSIK